MAERIDIEVVDKIASQIAAKLKDIAKQAKEGAKNIDELNKNINKLDDKKLKSLNTSIKQNADESRKAELHTAKLAEAYQKVDIAANRSIATAKRAEIATRAAASAQERLATSTNARLASEERLKQAVLATTSATQRLGVQTAKLQTAQQKLAKATADTAAAQTRLRQSQVQLLTNQQRLVIAQNQAAQSAVKLQITQAKLAHQLTVNATASQRLASATNQVASSATAAATATIRQQQALLRLQQQQARSTKTATGQSGSVSGGLIGGAGGILSAQTILQTEIAYQAYETRLRAVTDTEEEYTRIKQRLLEVSNATYAPLQATAILYQRFAPAADRLKVSEEGLLTIITNLNKAMALSGASTAEATGALIQLAQAVGANRLSGQELNSVLEQLPLVASVISDQLGITTDQLRKFANQGNVSGDDIFKAFSDAGKGVDELQRRFARLEPTIGLVSTIFANNFAAANDRLLDTLGATTALTSAILFLGDHMEIVFGVGTAAVIALTAALLTSTAAQKLLNLAVLANPYVLAAAAIAGVIAALVIMYDKSKAVQELWKDVSVTIQNVAIIALNALAPLLDMIDHFINGLQFINNGFSTVGTTAVDIGGAARDASKYLSDQLKAGTTVMEQAAETATNAIRRTSNASAELEDWFAKVRTGGWEAGQAAANSFDDASKSIQNATQSLKSYNDQVQQAGGAKIIHLDSSGTSTSDIMKIPGTSSSSITGIDTSTIDSNVIRGTYDYARGGPVYGPGTGKSDSIRANLSNGEFVVNAASTSRHRQLLEAINRSPIRNFAEGGYVTGEYSPGDFSQTAQKSSGTTGSFQIGGSDLEGILASGFAPFIGTGGAQGGYTFTGTYSPEVTASYQEQAAAIDAWSKSLKEWWSATELTITDATLRNNTDAIVKLWQAGIPKYTADPREYIEGGPLGVKLNPAYDRFVYQFQDVQAKLLSSGSSAAIMQGAPPWPDTVGNYVNFSGPSYGGSIQYGGTPNEAVNYALPPAQAPNTSQSQPTPKTIDEFFYGGFRNGGDFTVGGSGGPDSQLVQFMATPGERVSVDKNVQDAGDHGTNVTVRMEVYANDVRGFRESEQEIVSGLARKINAYNARMHN